MTRWDQKRMGEKISVYHVGKRGCKPSWLRHAVNASKNWGLEGQTGEWWLGLKMYHQSKRKVILLLAAPGLIHRHGKGRSLYELRTSPVLKGRRPLF